MNQAKSIDWLRITFAYGRDDFRDYQYTTQGGELRDRRPMKPYHDAKENKYQSIHWSDSHPEWRVMVEMTGKQLSEFRQDGHSISDLFKWAIALEGRFTRIDFAVDLFDCEGNPMDVYHCFHTSQVDTVAKSVSIVEKTRRKSTLGATVYIGSRSSERMVRVYDKGKQTKTRLDWIRVELEVKGKRAQQFAAIIDADGVADAGLAYLADVIDWTDIPWFNAIWSDDYTPVDIDSIGRPETDRERWLRTVVIPVIAEEVESGAEWLVEALDAILQSNDDRDKHGPKLTIPYK